MTFKEAIEHINQATGGDIAKAVLAVVKEKFSHQDYMSIMFPFATLIEEPLNSIYFVRPYKIWFTKKNDLTTVRIEFGTLDRPGQFRAILIHSECTLNFEFKDGMWCLVGDRPEPKHNPLWRAKTIFPPYQRFIIPGGILD